MKLTTRSMAWLSAAREVLSSVDPQSFPPIPHAPKPIADIFQPVRPKALYSMFSILAAKIVSLPVVYSNGMAFCKKRGRRPHPIPLHCVEREPPLQRYGEISPAVSARMESHGMCAFDTIALAVLPYERKYCTNDTMPYVISCILRPVDVQKLRIPRI